MTYARDKRRKLRRRNPKGYSLVASITKIKRHIKDISKSFETLGKEMTKATSILRDHFNDTGRYYKDYRGLL